MWPDRSKRYKRENPYDHSKDDQRAQGRSTVPKTALRLVALLKGETRRGIFFHKPDSRRESRDWQSVVAVDLRATGSVMLATLSDGASITEPRARRSRATTEIARGYGGNTPSGVSCRNVFPFALKVDFTTLGMGPVEALIQTALFAT